MLVHVNGTETELGGRYVGARLREATDLVDDGPALRRRLDEDGFVVIRGLLDRNDVMSAREAVLAPLVSDGVLDETVPPSIGVLARDELRSMLPGDWRTPDLRDLTEGPELRSLFERVLGGDVVTYDYKWVRSAGRGFHTGLHWDSIYWEQGEVFSCWIPLGDVSIEQGSLAVMTGAPKFFDEAAQAPRQLDQAFDFWGTVDPFDIMDRTGEHLETTDFRAGDVVVFTMYTPHCTLRNLTDRIRLSADIRYQLATEPVDHNYMGENPRHKEIISRTASSVVNRADLIGRL